MTFIIEKAQGETHKSRERIKGGKLMEEIESFELPFPPKKCHEKLARGYGRGGKESFGKMTQFLCG